MLFRNCFDSYLTVLTLNNELQVRMVLPGSSQTKACADAPDERDDWKFRFGVPKCPGRRNDFSFQLKIYWTESAVFFGRSHLPNVIIITAPHLEISIRFSTRMGTDEDRRPVLLWECFKRLYLDLICSRSTRLY